MRRAVHVTMLASASLSGLLAGAPRAWAQAPAEAANSLALEEVVVTAQRREQSLQEVPIAVSAITAAALQDSGITDTMALLQAVPGLDFGNQVMNGGAPFLRGVGSANNVNGRETSVAFYVDDVYHLSATSNLMGLDNIERIEILRGPQGTLFGRNATGGVIHVITRNPTAEPELKVGLGYGNFDTYEGFVYGTTALGDTTAVNLAVQGSDQREGWGRNITTGDDIHLGWEGSARGKLLWQPGSRLRVLLSADYGKRDGDFGINNTLGPGSLGIDGVSRGAGRYDSSGTPTDHLEGDWRGASARVDYDLEWAKLVSISAYRTTRQRVRFDQDQIPLVFEDDLIVQDQANYSQELQLQSPDSSRLKWIGGLYYLDGDAGFEPLGISGGAASLILFPGATRADIFVRQDVTSYAAFAQGAYEIFKDTNLTLGARYTEDQFDIAGYFADAGRPLFAPPAQSDSFSKLTHRVSLDHAFALNVMGYVSYGRGFKSGGYNLLFFTLPAVKPEVLDAYEAGLKSEWLDGRLRLNVAAFYNDYTDLQIQQVATGSAIVINAGAAEIKGAEIELAAMPIAGLTLTLGASALDGKYTSFPLGSLWTPNPVTGGNIQTSPVELRGRDTAHTPDFTGNVGASYVVRSSLGDWTFATNVYHNSGFFWDPDNRLKQGAFNLVNASVGWKSVSNDWDVRLWANNLTNEFHYDIAAAELDGDRTGPAAPRTYGVRITRSF